MDSDSRKTICIVRRSKPIDDREVKNDRRVKDAEVVVPNVYGSIAFNLGKKAKEYQTHEWTVYIRGVTNEDLGVVINKVIFELHPSFQNPTRVIDSPPFTLSERGWGEFSINITIFFHTDVGEEKQKLYHMLKLNPDVISVPRSHKRPLVSEFYKEIVLHDPFESFLVRVHNHPAVHIMKLPDGFNLSPPGVAETHRERKKGDTKDHPLSKWFIMTFSDEAELLKIAKAGHKVT